MRTTGTLTEIFRAAREIYYDGTHSPMNPVVRHANGKWMLESGLHSTDEGCDFEWSLESFHTYFYECYKSNDRRIPKSVEVELLRSYREDVLNGKHDQ